MSDLLASPPTKRDREEREFRSVFAGEFAAVRGDVAAVVGDPVVAEAVAREAFVRLLLSWRRVRLLGRPEDWVRRTALRLAGRGARRRPLSDVATTAESVVAEARRRRVRRQRAVVAVAAVAAVVAGDAVAVGQRPTDGPEPRSPASPSTSPRPTTLLALGPPPWAIDPRFSADDPHGSYPPSRLDGYWISPPLTRADLPRRAGDLPAGPFQLRIVARSSVFALWLGTRMEPRQLLLDYDTFVLDGGSVRFTPVGHSTWHTTYRWRIDGGRLAFTATRRSETFPGEPRRRALLTTSPFVRQR